MVIFTWPCQPMPWAADDVAGRVVVQQAQALFPAGGRANLLTQLTQRGGHRVLAPVQAASWQGELAGVPAQPGRAAGQPEGRTVLAVADSDRNCRRAPAVQRDGDAGERAQGLGDLIHSGRLVSRRKRLRLLEHFPVHAEVLRAGLVTGIIAITGVDSGGRCERCGRAVTLLSIRSAPDGAV